MLTDTHCHLNLPEFEKDLEQVIRSALETGLKKILVPGIDLPSSRRAVELADQYPGLIYAAVGIHPNYSKANDEDALVELRELLRHPSVVAVGEIGLDYYRDFADKLDQKQTFKLMLSLASEFGKPVCLHQRESINELIAILSDWHHDLQSKNSALANDPGVFHSFGGEYEILSWAMSHYFYLGISGFVTHKKADDLRLSLGMSDQTRLLIETDAPYITPEPLRGRRNEPSNVRLTAEKLAEIKGVDLSEVIRFTGENSATLFGW